MFLNTPTQRIVRVRQASLWNVNLGFCPELEIPGVGINLVLCKLFCFCTFAYFSFSMSPCPPGISHSARVITRPVCSQHPMAQQSPAASRAGCCAGPSVLPGDVAWGLGVTGPAGQTALQRETQTFANKAVYHPSESPMKSKSLQHFFPLVSLVVCQMCMSIKY